MRISSQQLVTSCLLTATVFQGCGESRQDDGGICPDQHTQIQPLSHNTQFNETGAEVAGALYGDHELAMPSPGGAERKLQIRVSEVVDAQATENVSSVEVCRYLSVPVHLDVRLDDESIEGELDGEARLSVAPVNQGTPELRRYVEGSAAMSAFSEFPAGDFPEQVRIGITVNSDGTLGSGSISTVEVAANTGGEQPTPRGRVVLGW